MWCVPTFLSTEASHIYHKGESFCTRSNGAPILESSSVEPFRHLHATDMGRNPFHARQKLHRVACKVGSYHYKRQDERYIVWDCSDPAVNKVEPQLVGTLKARTSTTAQVTSIGGFKGTTLCVCVGGFFHCSHTFITLATRTLQSQSQSQSQGYKMNLVGVRWNLTRNMDHHHPLVLGMPTEKSYWWSWSCLRKPSAIRNSESSVGYK